MKAIEKILNEEYGVGAMVASPVTVLWAAEKIKDAEQAKKELKQLNRRRAKYGKPLVYAPYGHHAF